MTHLKWLARAASLALAVSGGLQAQDAIPEPVAEAVRARAVAAGFEGSILVGARDGSSRTLVIGTSPLATDAVWRWASITKQLAAVLAMQEVARGTLDLDAPVTRYWPQWTAPNGSSIRIRDLLRHNSGLPQPDASTPDAMGVPGFYAAAAATPETSAAAFCAGPSRAAAPAGFEYNNCDTIVLAEVLTRISGKSFDTLAHERLAEPLGMTSFGLYTLHAPLRTHVPATGDSTAVDSLIDLGVFGAAGGAYGTIGDLWRFDRALLSGELLPGPQRELMWTSSRESGYVAFFQWTFPATLRGCAAARTIVERQGQIGAFEHRNFLLPESGRALILFSNHVPASYGNAWEGKGLAYDLLSLLECGPGYP